MYTMNVVVGLDTWCNHATMRYCSLIIAQQMKPRSAGQGAADLQTDKTCEAILRAIEAVHAAYTCATQVGPSLPVKSAKGAAKPSSRPKAAAQEPNLSQPLQACSCPAGCTLSCESHM